MECNKMANGWTAERRAKQAALIRTWKPWEKSTGAKTPEGKAISAKNAYRYAQRELCREMLRESRELRRENRQLWQEMRAMLALSAELEKNGVMQLLREMAREQAALGKE
jgi:urease accessory protein UreF